MIGFTHGWSRLDVAAETAPANVFRTAGKKTRDERLARRSIGFDKGVRPFGVHGRLARKDPASALIARRRITWARHRRTSGRLNSIRASFNDNKASLTFAEVKHHKAQNPLNIPAFQRVSFQ